MCDQIQAAPCAIELLILRHTLESRRNSNTGALVASALQSATLVEYANPKNPWDSSLLKAEDTWLLYPSPGAKLPQAPPKRLVILDASWSQARRMAQRIPELRGMPTLALPAPERALPRLRRGANEQQMSTAESVACALRQLGQQRSAEHLEVLLREMVRRFSLPQRRGPQPKKTASNPATTVLSTDN